MVVDFAVAVGAGQAKHDGHAMLAGMTVRVVAITTRHYRE